MTRSHPLFLLAAMCGLVSPAFAATPTPCTSYAGLADADGDKFCAFVGAATAATSGWNGKVDCRDDIAAINPRATEKVGDGIDQDCSGADLTLPVSDQQWTWFVADEYKGRAPSQNLFVAEYNACTAATASRCKIVVGNGDGRFEIVDPEKDIFCDVFVAGTSIVGTDRIREVVSLEVASHKYRDIKSGDERCKVGASTSSSSAPAGVSKKAATAIAEKAAADALKPEADARSAADKAHDAAIASIRSDNDARDGVINGHTAQIATNEAAISAVSAAAVDLTAGLAAAAEKVEAAVDTADAAASHGPLFEGGVVGGGVDRKSVV